MWLIASHRCCRWLCGTDLRSATTVTLMIGHIVTSSTYVASVILLLHLAQCKTDKSLKGQEFHIDTAPQKCMLSVTDRIQVVYLCIYVTRARYSRISLISWQNLSFFKTHINYNEYWSCANTVIFPIKEEQKCRMCQLTVHCHLRLYMLLLIFDFISICFYWAICILCLRFTLWKADFVDDG